MTLTMGSIVWSRAAANDLARGLLTPLTWSILSRSAERAVRGHYRAWGVALPVDVPIWRRVQGRAYLNTTALAAADHAIAAGEMDVSSGWRLFGRSPERRQHAALREQIEQAPDTFSAAQQWWERVRTTQWRQATLLQVMEEIEPRAEAVLTTRDYLTTALGASRRQITRWVAEWQPESRSTLFDDLFAGLDGREGWAQYRYDLQALTEAARRDTGSSRQELDAFISAYGRWADQPLETASPRWAEAPQELAARLAFRLAQPPEPPLLSPLAARQRRAGAAAQVMAALVGRQRRQFEPVWEQLQQIVDLLPASREALVTVIAAARHWALAAAQEAVNDGRLAAVDDVFLLELEELKQMMTGEWSSPQQVQAIVGRRRDEQTAWAAHEPAEVLEESS